MSRARNLLFGVALVAGALALALGLGEVGTRVFLETPQTVIVQRTADVGERLEHEARTELTLSAPQLPPHGGLYVETTTGRRLRANTRAIIENHEVSRRRVEIRTNSLGFRNPDLGRKAQTRILFLGDSITFADYLAEDETFVRLVEIFARQSGRRWQTINAGVGGISLKSELAILLETGLPLEPDVVVVGFYLNDFQESPGVYIPRLPRAIKASRLLHYLAHRGIVGMHVLLGRLHKGHHLRDTFTEGLELERWRRELAQRLARDADGADDALDAAVLRNFRDWGGVWSPEVWSYLRPLFAELKRQSTLHGFRLIVVCFPVRHQVAAAELRDYPQRQLARVAEELEISTLDLLPAFRTAYREPGQPIFYDHCHHTPEGSELVAREVFEFLASRLSEPG